jgi:hypothetical protein
MQVKHFLKSLQRITIENRIIRVPNLAIKFLIRINPDKILLKQNAFWPHLVVTFFF